MRLKEQVEGLEKKIDDNPRRVEERISRLLDEKGAMAGNFTRMQLHEEMRSCIKEVLLAQASVRQVRGGVRREGAQRLDDSRVDDTHVRRRVILHEQEATFFHWKNGAIRRLPYNFRLTEEGDDTRAPLQATALQAYLYWCLPNGAAKVGPLRQCTTSDFSDKNQKKRFSDWKRFANFLHTYIIRDKPSRSLHYHDVQAVTDQFTLGMGIHMIHVKYLHPSKLKRKRITTRRHAQAALKVSHPSAKVHPPYMHISLSTASAEMHPSCTSAV